MHLERIHDINDPRLAVYRDVRRNRSAQDQGLFIAEGTTVVRRLFESDFDTVSVLVSDKKWAGFAEHIPAGTHVYRIAYEEICELVGFRFHAGVIACGRRQGNPDLNELLQNATGRRTIVVAPHLTDPENVGALIRIGAAFGVTAAIFGDACTDVFSRRAIRVSMANGLFLPIIQTPHMKWVFETLKNHGIRSHATVLDSSATSLEDIRCDGDAALVFGNETHGLDEQWAGLCDERVTIPMHGMTDSLNISVSAGVFLFWFTCRDRAE